MASITFVGSGSNIAWGSSAITSPNGILSVISATYEQSGETIEVLDESGIPDGFVIVPGITTATIEGYASTIAVPTIGSVANITNVNVYVESVRTSWEQKGIKKVSVTAKALPA
jgi:hypothetical protein